jgi:hypothetical protein
MLRWQFGLLLAALLGLVVGPTDGVARRVARPRAARPRRVCPVVAEGMLLGGSLAGRWMSAERTSGLLHGGERYRLYSLSGSLGTAVGTKPEAGEPDRDTLFVELSPAPREGVEGVAIGGEWSALPRRVRRQTAIPAAYQDDMRRVLRARGITVREVDFTGVFRVDLDGDGTEEVVLNATNQRPNRLSFTPTSGDYSVVAVRRVVRGVVKTIVLDAACFARGGPEAHAAATVLTVPAVVDANGDGVMEVLVEGREYEGCSVDAYALRGDRAERVIGAGAGV